MIVEGVLLREGDQVPSVGGGLRATADRRHVWEEVEALGVYRGQPHQQPHLRNEGSPSQASIWREWASAACGIQAFAVGTKPARSL